MNNGGLRGLLPAFAALLACLCVGMATSARTAAGETSPTGEKGACKPMVYLSGALYEDICHVTYELPEKAVLVGTVEKTVPNDRPMAEEELCSNSLPEGTELYRDEAEPRLLYARLAPAEGTGGYSVFQTVEG